MQQIAIVLPVWFVAVQMIQWYFPSLPHDESDTKTPVIAIRNLLVIDVGQATREDLIEVTFSGFEQPVYVWFDKDRGDWLLDREFTPNEVWETAASLHQQGLNRLSAAEMRWGFDNVDLAVCDSGFHTLQPNQILCISYHFPLQSRTMRANYGESFIMTVTVTTREIVRANCGTS